MSSISSSDRSNADEQIRNARENYKEREEELVKKHRKEINRINQAHSKNVDELKERQDEKLAELRDKSKKALTRQDMEYQQDIRELKNFYNTRLRKQNSETFDRERQLLLQSRQQKQAMEQNHEYRIKKLKDDHARTVDTKDKALADMSVRNKNEHQKGFKELRQKLSEAHNEELTRVQEDRRDKVYQMRKDYDRMRLDKDRKIEELQEDKERTIGDLRKDSYAQLREKDENYQDMLDYQRGEYKNSLENTREEYSRLAEEMHEKNRSAQLGLAADVGQRTNNKIGSLEREIRDLERSKIKQRVDMERQFSREQNNLKSALQANIENLQEQRRIAIDSSNERTANEILEIRKESDKHNAENNRFYLNKMSDLEARHKMKSIQQDQKYNTDMSTQRTEEKARFDSLKQQFENQQRRLKENYDQSKETLKANHQEALDELQRANQMEKQKLISSLESRVAEISQKQNEQLARVHAKYQQKIVDMQDEHKKEVRHLESNQKRILENRERQNKMQADSKEIKYKTQMEDMQRAQREEVARIQSRHREELENLVKNRRT